MPLKSNPETTRQWRERTQQKARDNPKPRAKIRAVSPKRRAQNADYTTARRADLEAFPLCVRCAGAGREEAATEIHHAGGREGARLLDTNLFRGLCSDCHRWAHDNPAAARECGLLTTKHLTSEEL